MAVSISEIEAESGGHALFAPSGSPGWTTCPDYLLVNYARGDGGSSVYAAQGTVFHRLMEVYLPHGVLPFDEGEVVEQDGHEVVVDHEMLESARECRERGMKIIEGCDEWHVEQRVDHSDLTPIPDQKGTCDWHAVHYRRQHIDIIDFKYGEGEWVDAENNSQLGIYGYAVFRKHDWLHNIQTITLHVFQPRRGNFQSWTMTRDEMLHFAGWVKDRASVAWRALVEGPIARVPSHKGCRWCAAAKTCPANLALIERITADAFDDLDAPVANTELATVQKKLDQDSYAPRLVPPAEMTSDQLGRVLKLRKQVEAWFNAIAAEVQTRIDAGEKVPGWKVVESRKHRRWTDRAVAENTITALGVSWFDLWEMSFVTPAKAIDLVRRRLGVTQKKAEEIVADLLHTPPGDRTLVPEGDTRAELPALDHAFDDLDAL